MADSIDTITGYLLLFLAVLFAAWGFQHELYFVDVQFSDVAFHLSILKNLDKVVKTGGNFLDFWYDTVPYGFALFRSYQYLPYLFIYGIYRLCGEYFSLAQVLMGCTFALGTLLPLSLFYALRLVGARTLEGGIAALLSVLISDGSEFGMGLQNFTFGTYGLITQLWAMVFLFPAIAACYQYIHTRKNLGMALLFSFLTFGSHVMAAVILVFCAAIFSAGMIIKERRLIREPFIFFGLFIPTTAHQWWFVLADSHYINRSLLEPKWKYEGRGFKYLIELFWNGDLFDNSRLPVLTLLLIIALCYLCFYAKKVRVEAGGSFFVYAPVLFLLFFTLCVGRTVWGPVFDLIPVLKSLHVHRFSIGIHLFGIIIIAVGVASFIRHYATTTARAVLLLFLFLICLRPALLEREQMFRENFNRHRDTAQLVEKDQDLQHLISATAQASYGWTYIGSSTSWQGSLLTAGYVPLDLFTTMQAIPTVGGILYHAFSLAGETLFDFNPDNRAHFDLFGIRKIISPSSWAGVSGFSRAGTFGRYALWTRDSHMLFVADGRFKTSSNFSGQTDQMRTFVQNYATPQSNLAGTIIDQKMDAAWRFEGTALMQEAGRIVGTVGFHPNWKITVDGIPAATHWVTPGFVEADVPQGKHLVSFVYEGSRAKKYLLMLAFVILGGTLLFPMSTSKH